MDRFQQADWLAGTLRASKAKYKFVFIHYGYREGDVLPNSGHLRVRVAPDGVTVEYVRSATSDLERQGIRNGEVAFRYAIPP
jgi:hypothetical protein